MGALGYIIEEKIFGKYEKMDPLLVVGYEGFFSLIFWIICLSIF
jgi:hypothetical protein